MKKILYTILMLMLLPAATTAQTEAGAGAKIDKGTFLRNSLNVSYRINIDLRGVHPKSNRAVVITPFILKNDKCVEFRSVVVYGRSRYYHYQRNNGDMMLTGRDEISYLCGSHPEQIMLKETIPYENWMDNSQLRVRTQIYGCCDDIMEESEAFVATLPVYIPEFVYVTPEAERVKSRSISGSAFIDFVVNSTTINEAYRGNAVELAKIRDNINSVRDDEDIDIKSMSIKGFASPEGSYANNERLARERTEALKKYVLKLYDFPAESVRTSYEAEDWAGCRRKLSESSLEHKDEILAMINNPKYDGKYDRLDHDIRRTYPSDYRYMLDKIYPALRHSDYTVNFVIHTFSDPEVIRQKVLTDPRKLSLNEFFIASQECEPGSHEFNKTFETAVAMYPDSEVANLNAAVSALQRGDMKGAPEYLRKAGTSKEAIYARGVFYALTQQYAEAAKKFEEALKAGLREAEEALRQVKLFM